MEWVVVLWFYKGMTSFPVTSVEACADVVYGWTEERRDARGWCINSVTGETISYKKLYRMRSN